MHGYKWKTLLKWMVWGENPLFSETPISKQHTVVSNHGPPPSKVKKSFSHPSFRRNKNHHDSNDELPLDQKSQLIKKTWIWMIRILGSPWGLKLEFSFPSFPGCTSCATLVTPARPPIWATVLGFREFPTTGDRQWQVLVFGSQHLENISKLYTYRSFLIDLQLDIIALEFQKEICIELIWVQLFFLLLKENKTPGFSSSTKFIIYS